MPSNAIYYNEETSDFDDCASVTYDYLVVDGVELPGLTALISKRIRELTKNDLSVRLAEWMSVDDADSDNRRLQIYEETGVLMGGQAWRADSMKEDLDRLLQHMILEIEVAGERKKLRLGSILQA